jgi:hypothetical protein
MNKNMQMYLAIMAFYILLSYLIMPALFYYFIGKSLTSAGNGFMLGSALSIIMWQFYGRLKIE